MKRTKRDEVAIALAGANRYAKRAADNQTAYAKAQATKEQKRAFIQSVTHAAFVMEDNFCVDCHARGMSLSGRYVIDHKPFCTGLKRYEAVKKALAAAKGFRL